jgi:hypothetical protein
MGTRQLTIQHRHKLAPTAEATRVPISLMLADEGFELQPRELLEKLTKNAAYSIQGEVSFRLVVSFFGRTPLNLTEASPFRQNLNLDKCGMNACISYYRRRLPQKAAGPKRVALRYKMHFRIVETVPRYAIIFCATFPATSVSRKLRPL